MDYTKELCGQTKKYYDLHHKNFINSISVLLTYENQAPPFKQKMYIKPKRSNRNPDCYTDLITNTRSLNPTRVRDMIKNIIDDLNMNVKNQLLQFATVIFLYDNTLNRDIVLLKFPAGLNIYHGSKILHDTHAIKNSIYYEDLENMIKSEDYNEYLTNKQKLNSFYSDIPTATSYSKSTMPESQEEYLKYTYPYDKISNVPRIGMNTYITADDIYVLFMEFDVQNYVNIKGISKKYGIPELNILSFLNLKNYNVQAIENYYLNHNLFNTFYDDSTKTVITYPMTDPHVTRLYQKYKNAFGLDSLYSTLLFREYNFAPTKSQLISYIQKYCNLLLLLTSYDNFDLNETTAIQVNFVSNTGIDTYQEFRKKLFDIIFKPGETQNDTVLLTNLNNPTVLNNVVDLLKSYKGHRISYYDVDGVVFNRLMYFIYKVLDTNYKTYNISVKGIYDAQFAFLLGNSFFHQEIILNPVNTVNRNYDNNLDEFQGVNENQLLTEFRKYKTSNILVKGSGVVYGFHESNLTEHSIWSGLYSIIFYNYFIKRNFIVDTLKNKNFNNDYVIGDEPVFLFTVILASLYHDLGKAGDCKYENYEFVNRNTSKYSLQECKFNKVFAYHDLDYHPEKSYYYLTNKEYKLSTYDFNLKFSVKLIEIIESIYKKYSIPTVITKYSKSIDHDIDLDMLSIFKIAISCHWYYGDIVLKNYNIDYSSLKISIDDRFIIEYMRKVLFYFNEIKINYYDTTLKKFGLRRFLMAFKYTLIVCVMVSTSDILGSKFPSDYKKMINTENFMKTFTKDNNYIFDLLNKISPNIFLQLFRYTPVETTSDIDYKETVLQKTMEELITCSALGLNQIIAFCDTMIEKLSIKNFNLLFGVDDYLEIIDQNKTTEIDNIDMKSIMFFDLNFLKFLKNNSIKFIYTKKLRNICKFVMILSTDDLNWFNKNINLKYFSSNFKVLLYDPSQDDLEYLIKYEVDLSQNTNSVIYSTVVNNSNGKFMFNLDFLEKKHNYNLEKIKLVLEKNTSDNIKQDMIKAVNIAHFNNYQKYLQEMIIKNKIDQVDLLNNKIKYVNYVTPDFKNEKTVEKDINDYINNYKIKNEKMISSNYTEFINKIGKVYLKDFNFAEFILLYKKFVKFFNEPDIENNPVISNNYFLILLTILVLIYDYYFDNEDDPVQRKMLQLETLEKFIKVQIYNDEIITSDLDPVIKSMDTIIDLLININSFIVLNQDNINIKVGLNVNSSIMITELKNYTNDINKIFSDMIKDNKIEINFREFQNRIIFI